MRGAAPRWTSSTGARACLPTWSERIFEPFFRLPGAPSGGAGLGLSIARQIARRHGGGIACLPRDGGGTLFRATLK